MLKDDTATIERIEQQLGLYQVDMRQQFDFHRTRIENIIAKMNARGDEYFEDTIRIGRIFDLLNGERSKLEFQQKVVGDTEKTIDDTVDNLIDWMVEQDLRTWQAITDHVDRRRLSTYEDEMIGEISGQFRYDRRTLLEAVSETAQEEVERYDVQARKRTSSRPLSRRPWRRLRLPKRERSGSARSSSRPPARLHSMSPASSLRAC